MSSTFDRPSSSSEDEFYDACSGDEESVDDAASDQVNREERPQSPNDIAIASTSSPKNEVFIQPKAPPRKKKIKKVDSFNEANPPAAVAASPAIARDHLKIDNITNYVDDIASIQGDLSVTDAYVSNSDRKNVHVDDLKRKDLSDDLINRLVEENRLREQQAIKTPKDSKSFFRSTPASAVSSAASDDYNVAANATAKSTLIKETISEGDDTVNCINPINLHLLKITNDYDSDETVGEDDERSSQVTEKISDTLDPHDDLPLKKEALKNTVKNLKKFGQGFIKSVQKVKNSASTSTVVGGQRAGDGQYLDARYDQQPDQQQPNQFKFKSNRKKEPAEFDSLKIIQELNDCNGAIWCMKWSVCGKLLAVAGKDQLLRVYCCYSAWKYFTQMRSTASSGGANQISPNSTSSNKERSFSGSRNSISSLNQIDGPTNQSFESVLHNTSFSKFVTEDNVLSEEGPLLLFSAYNGHKADVLDIAWSKNHFLLSSSMDKTVLLWHVSRVECLCIFRHIDFVTTIQFHPRDDRYFLYGSLDGKVRLWNIPDKRVTLWNEVNALPVPNRSKSQGSSVPSYGLITASAFVQNGKFAVIGTYDGRVIFYTTDQLKYFTQLHIGSEKQQISSARLADSSATDRRGKPKQNFKITGIEGLDENKILVTTNDSRIRLYDLRDLSLACKYKGHTNISSQIRASVSHDNKFIVCGSENSSFYIWKLVQDNTLIGQRRDRNSQWESIRILPNSNSLFYLQKSNNLNSATSGSKTSNNPGIITAATFATMPTILDENAKYVIAVADFNGCIRLFAKY